MLVLALAVVFYWLVGLALRTRKTDPMQVELDVEIPKTMPMRRPLAWLILGCVLLLISSRLLVWGTVNIAVAMHVSDLAIGLTIVAVATSLPKLAAGVASTIRGGPDITVGQLLVQTCLTCWRCSRCQR